MKMKENILIEKSIDFGARIVKLHRYLVKEKHETVLSKQILRSGTSIGANINEALMWFKNPDNNAAVTNYYNKLRQL